MSNPIRWYITRRLSFYENDAGNPRQNDGDLVRPQMPHAQTRYNVFLLGRIDIYRAHFFTFTQFSHDLILPFPPRQFDGGNNLAERPRKMARPSTAGPTSSSPSGAWRSGSAPRSNRLGNDETSSIGRGENDALQGRRATSNRQGMSLGSLLDGRGPGLASESADAERYNTKSENRTSQMQQQLGRGQPSETTHGQQFRNSSVSGQQQSFAPQIPSYAPSPLGPGQGPQRPMNTSKVERPLTPSTLFLQNAIQSQNFSRQNPQQIRQEQQVRNAFNNCVCTTAFNGC